MQVVQDFSIIDSNISRLIPNNHILRKVNQYVDFSFIYKITENLYSKDTGRPSIDPVLFFRIQIIGYMFNIPSERKLCEEINLNMAYRWFCGINLSDRIPNHS